MGEKPWTLRWGIHRGTIISRDMGDDIPCDSLEACRTETKKLKRRFGRIGYKLWYARAVGPGGQSIGLASAPYAR